MSLCSSRYVDILIMLEVVHGLMLKLSEISCLGRRWRQEQ